MTLGLKLRDYQRGAIDAVRGAWATGMRRPAVVLPTGTGKTVVFTGLAAEMHEVGVRSVITAHRDELIQQAANKLRTMAPHLRVGILQGPRREVRGRDVVVASIQTLARSARRAELAREGFRLVIVDECHHAVANSYVETLRTLGCWSEDPAQGAYAVGVTATLGRSDRLALGQVWDDVVYRRDIVDMIKAGHLVNAKGIRVKIAGLDLARVRRVGGDYQDAALAEAMHEALAPAAIARAYVEHAGNRSGVLFAPTVAMAYECAEALRAVGIPAVGLDGTVPTADRRRILADHARGDIRVVCNCAVLTEGWDAPWCEVAVIARPTQSTTLYVQMAGRVLRPHPGKRGALIIDVVGVTGKHRLAGLIDLGGADRVEKLPDELQRYEDAALAELDLLGLLAPDPPSRAPRTPDAPGADGALTAEVVDLFGLRRQAWLRTQRGVWFLSEKEGFIFIAPGDEVGDYRVGRVSGAGGEWLVPDGVDLEMAMTWGEQHATSMTRKNAGWRARMPTDKQVKYAARLGIAAGVMDSGALGDAISVVEATRRLDGMSCVATVSGRGYW